MRRHFLSDLHLSAAHPDLSQAFIAYCRGPALQAEEIWLLGDLFEYWLGDDIALPDYAAEVEALHALAQQRAVHFLPGNRDFLCGENFATAAGLKRHTEPVILDEEPRLLLMHGDTLCLDDQAYQRYRRVVHTGWVQKAFLTLAPSWRKAIVQRLREQGQKHNKPLPILDARPEAAQAQLEKHQAAVLIHGHTHRPARHEYAAGLRIVLPDWRPEQPQSWQWLEQHQGEFCLHSVS